MAKVLIITSVYLYDLTEDDVKIDEDVIYLYASGVEKDVVEDGRVLRWESSRPRIVDTATDNIGRCSICGRWCTNCEAPERIGEINNGAKINGRLYCDECLPEDHRWAF